MTSMVERMARAMEEAEVGYSMTLTRLVDGVSTYVLKYNDGEDLTFVDNDEGEATARCYAHIANKKRVAKALAALRQMRNTVDNDALEAMHKAMFADAFDATNLPMLNAGFVAAIDAEIAAYEAGR